MTLPIIVNGRIDRPDDKDVFRFDATGRVVAEVYARRAGSPLDAAVSVTDATGAEIGFNDDFRDEAQPLITHHADSLLTATMSGKGPYCLHLSDAQRKGGHDFIYRLYVRAPRPDVDLRVVPSCIVARPGAVVPITAHAVRREGFDDPIHLSLVEPPEGFKLDGAVVPGKADRVRLTLTIPPVAPKEPFLLEMDGQSLGSTRHRRFTRPVIPAESMMQAFLWLQIVPAEQWAILVNGQPAAKPPLELLPVERINLRPGGTTPLGAKLTAKYPPANELRVQLTSPPKGVSVERVSPEGPGLVVVLAADAKTAEPGLEGNLIFEVVREWTPAATEERPKPQQQRMSYGILPAVPFQVIGQAKRR